MNRFETILFMTSRFSVECGSFVWIAKCRKYYFQHRQSFKTLLFLKASWRIIEDERSLFAMHQNWFHILPLEAGTLSGAFFFISPVFPNARNVPESGTFPVFCALFIFLMPKKHYCFQQSLNFHHSELRIDLSTRGYDVHQQKPVREAYKTINYRRLFRAR